MSKKAWHSKPIQITDEVSIDVSANARGVTLGEAAATVWASDLLISPDNARELAGALQTGATHAEKAKAWSKS